MRVAVNPAIVERSRCRWCGAPGRVVELVQVVPPPIAPIVCAEPVACVKRQALQLEKGRIDLGDARRVAVDRRRQKRRLERARRRRAA